MRLLRAGVQSIRSLVAYSGTSCWTTTRSLYSPSRSDSSSHNKGSIPMNASQWMGWALGYVDNICITAARMFDKNTFFDDGIGDIHAIAQSEQAVKSACLGESSIPEMKNLVWETEYDESKYGDACIEEAMFDAPFHELLPPECKRAHFQLVRPKQGHVRGRIPTYHSVVIHFQMTADETFDFRRNSISMKLLSSGIASILLMAPMYGGRRPVGQERHYYRTVSDFFQAGVVNMFEGAMLVEWCRKEFPGANICLTGISAGATPASATALLCSGEMAVVPCIGPGSGRPFVKGALSSYVNWDSIAESIGVNDIAQAQDYMADFFASKHLKKMAQWRRESGRKSSLVAISVAASDDQVIHRDDSQELHDLLADVSVHEEIQWLPGGHVIAIQQSGAMFTPVISRAIDILQHKFHSSAQVDDTNAPDN